jgi:nitroreductase
MEENNQILGKEDFDRLFMERKSVRAYADRPISPELKDALIAATMRSATAGNMMLYSILEIEDPAIKARLAETCDHQPFIATAPLVLVYLADYARMTAFFEVSRVKEILSSETAAMAWPRESDLLLAASDAMIAAQTTAIAAQALGLGSCYIGDIMEHWEVHRDLFRLPRYAFPVAMLCIGYPTEQQKQRSQPPRLPVSAVVHKNHYALPGPELLATLYTGPGYASPGQGKGKDEPKNAGQALYRRKFDTDYSREMRRSVKAMLDAWWRKDPD